MLYTTAETAEAVRAAEIEIRVLLERARGGDVEALPALRAALDSNPGLWLHWGDLGARVREHLITLIAGPDLAFRESLGRRVVAMMGELAGPGAPPLERLLGERVVATWLQVNHADVMAARTDVSVKQAAFALKRAATAQRKHLMAIGALASVRKLLPPAVEIVGSEVVPSGSVTVDVTYGVGGDYPTGVPGERPDIVAGGESAGPARVIPINSGRGAARTRRA